MLERLTVERRLEIHAENGETSAPLKLWKSTISRLRTGGFTVDIIASTERKGEFYCNVDWKKPHGQWAYALLRLTITALEDNC